MTVNDLNFETEVVGLSKKSTSTNIGSDRNQIWVVQKQETELIAEPNVNKICKMFQVMLL